MTILYCCLIVDVIALFAGWHGFNSGSIPVSTPLILAYVFGFIGFNMLMGSFFSYSETQTWLASTVSSSGEVIDHEGRESGDSFNRETKRDYTAYYPVVRFQTQRGQDVTFTSSVGSSTLSHTVGQRVAIRYLAGNPQRAEIDEFMSIWLVPLVLGCLGIAMAGASVGLTVANLKA